MRYNKIVGPVTLGIYAVEDGGKFRIIDTWSDEANAAFVTGFIMKR